MKQPPEDLAQKLVDAAEQFTGTGLDVSIDDVAQAAEVPRATLYYYFSGKDDLIAFFLNHKLEAVGTAIAKAAAGEGSVTERLDSMTRAVLTAMAKQPALCTELPAALRRTGASTSDVALKAEQIMAAPVRELLIEGRATGELNVPDVEVALSALHGAIGQAAFTELIRHGTFDPDELADNLVPVLLEGLRAR